MNGWQGDGEAVARGKFLVSKVGVGIRGGVGGGVGCVEEH